MKAKRAVFLDRDGTLIEDAGFLADPLRVRVLPTVVAALRLLTARGYACIVISNQSGVARGYFDQDAVRAVNAEIARRLGNDGVALDGWYWCPHYDDGCDCRKPEPGLLHRAVREHGVVLQRGAVVGDRGSDIELAHRAGIAGVLVPGPAPYEGPPPDFRARTLLEAAEWIVRDAH
ncbi:MAG: D-glycero-alpha-D-manno-heptose-1,7-bisphosphate 7-phosphatase [Candidatus Velthaea sp.]